MTPFAYIHTYHELGWISTIEFRRLMHMIKSLDYKPHTIVLNPEKRVIKERLSERIKERSRSTRDQVFAERIRTISYFISIAHLVICRILKTSYTSRTTERMRY